MTHANAPVRRSRATGQDTRRRVLQAAERLFSERSYNEVTVRDIAAEAQADPALVIRYFESKAALFLHVRRPQLGNMPRREELKNPEQLTRWLVNLLLDQGTRLMDVTAPGVRAAHGPMRQQLNDILVTPVLDALDDAGGDRADIELVAALVIGVVFLRERIGPPALTALSAEEIIDRLTPLVTVLLGGASARRLAPDPMAAAPTELPTRSPC